jgi:hypothetical protein
MSAWVSGVERIRHLAALNLTLAARRLVQQPRIWRRELDTIPMGPL